MIYISSAAIRRESVISAVEELAKNGFLNIELTAGNQLTTNWLDELLELKHKYQLNYLCHNYFPVPEDPFVLNLASLDEKTHQQSVDLAKKAIETSRLLGGDKYGIHAGFRIDIPVAQIGKKIEKIEFFDETSCWAKFTETIDALYADFQDVNLYVENNVFSGPNFGSYGGVNPFYVTHQSAWDALILAVPHAKLLLDVAHLKVSCQSLGNDFEKELQALAGITNYIHLSDNDGRTDSNQPITEDSAWLHQMSEMNLSKENTYTVEVYGELSEVRQSVDLVEKMLL